MFLEQLRCQKRQPRNSLCIFTYFFICLIARESHTVYTKYADTPPSAHMGSYCLHPLMLKFCYINTATKSYSGYIECYICICVYHNSFLRLVEGVRCTRTPEFQKAPTTDKNKLNSKLQWHLFE